MKAHGIQLGQPTTPGPATATRVFLADGWLVTSSAFRARRRYACTRVATPAYTWEAVLKFFRYLLVWLVSTAACLVGLVPIAAFGVMVPGEIVLPLAMGLGGLLAAIAARWTDNALAPDRGRLLPIVGATEIAAAVVAVGFLALLYYQGALQGFMAPLINPLLVSAGIISLFATVATALLRTTESGP